MSIVDAADAPLDPAERDAIAGFATHYPSPKAACVEALKYVQRTRFYISQQLLAEIGSVLGMPVTELDEVATFYNLIFRRPVGENVILLCDSVTCWMMGGDAIARGIGQVLGIGLGETTPDQRYTLLPTVCLGHCDHAPAMMIGDALHGDLQAERLAEILQPATTAPA